MFVHAQVQTRHWDHVCKSINRAKVKTDIGRLGRVGIKEEDKKKTYFVVRGEILQGLQSWAHCSSVMSNRKISTPWDVCHISFWWLVSLLRLFSWQQNFVHVLLVLLLVPLLLQGLVCLQLLPSTCLSLHLWPVSRAIWTLRKHVAFPALCLLLLSLTLLVASRILLLCQWGPGCTCTPCGWRGYEREEKEGERERLINLSTCGCMIQLYLWENTQFIEIREFGWGFLMLTS